MPTLSEGLAKIRSLRVAHGESDTDPQRRWAERLANTEKLLVAALDLEEQVAASPDDTGLRRNLGVRRGQVKLALRQIIQGAKSYRRNYEEAHGATEAERRAGWNKAYADRILEKKGRVVRKNKKRSDMTPEEWAAHRREKERIAKAKQRAKKKKEEEK